MFNVIPLLFLVLFASFCHVTAVIGPMITLVSCGEVTNSWHQARYQCSPLPPGVTAKGDTWTSLLDSNYLALSSLLQASASESGTGISRRETPYSPSNQQVRLRPGLAMWGKAGWHVSRKRQHQGRKVEEAKVNFCISE